MDEQTKLHVESLADSMASYGMDRAASLNALNLLYLIGRVDAILDKPILIRAECPVVKDAKAVQ